MVKTKRRESRSALCGPLRARPRTDGKLLSFDMELGQVEVQVERLQFEFPFICRKMSPRNERPHPGHAGPLFHF